MDIAYAGDALGNLWKFDLRTMQVGNGGQPLLQTTAPDGSPQPITATPGISQKAKASRIIQLVIGTGKFFEQTDLTERQVQSIYGVRDFTPDADANVRTRETATRNNNRLLQRAYARKNGANDVFTYADDTEMSFQSWKLADAPDVTYDPNNASAGHLGYSIDLDGDGMAGIGASGAEASVSGWRVLVQGTDMRTMGMGSDNYLLPTLIPKDDPCNDKNSGGIVEMDSIHGKWVKTHYWKAVRNGANIWHDPQKPGGREIGLDRKGKTTQYAPLLDLSTGDGDPSSWGYTALTLDSPDTGGFKDDPTRQTGCTFMSDGDRATRVDCPGRSGRQSWRQLQ
jgi:hypothetical protein